MTKAYRHLINKLFITSLVLITIIWVWKERDFPQLQIQTIVVSVFAYLIWALFYHSLDKSLTLTIFMEYLLTALLALILLMGVLL